MAIVHESSFIQVQWQKASKCLLQDNSGGKEVCFLQMGFQWQFVHHCEKQATELHGLIQQGTYILLKSHYSLSTTEMYASMYT